MDEYLRRLDRLFDIDQDQIILKTILHHMLRFQSFEAWEEAARGNDYFAIKYLNRLFDLDSKWVNIYEDFTARTTILCQTFKNQWDAKNWASHFYSSYPILYQGGEVYPVDLYPIDESALEKSAKLRIRISDNPCFKFDAHLKEGEKREIDLWGNRERYVTFVLRDSLEILVDNALESTPKTVQISPTEKITEILDGWPYRLLYEVFGQESEISPGQENYFTYMSSLGYHALYWINVYEVQRLYGGPEEGGTYYDHETPIASVYVGLLPSDRDGESIYWFQFFNSWTQHVKEAWMFLSELFAAEENQSIVIRLSTEIGHMSEPYHYE